MKCLRSTLILFLFSATVAVNAQNKQAARKVWDASMANKWYAGNSWLVGANFLPSTAINQLEMWQAETFDTTTISRELKWAASIGMNTMRVFLHDQVHRENPQGFKKRIEIFLRIANRYNIKPLFVLFD